MSDAGDLQELVFVYGTLRRGGSNAFRMEGAAFRGAARVQGELHAITWYPGLTLKEGAGWVIGEVYRVGPEQMRALDEFEGLSAGEVEGSEYRRVKVSVVLGEAMVPAWVYEWMGPVDPGKKVVSGDWLDVVQPRQAPVFTWVCAAMGALLLGCVFVSILSFSQGYEWKFRGFSAVYLGLPICGFVAGLMGDRRRESLKILRLLGCCVCLVGFWAAVIVMFVMLDS